MSMLLYILSLMQAAGAVPAYSLHGKHRTLAASAPENQVLLDLEEMPIKDTFATVGDAFAQNHELQEHLEKIISKPYFSTYKVDLSDARCPFDDDTATCGNRQCAIEPLSSKDIDENLFRSQFLGRLRKNSVSREAPDGAAGEDCAPAAASLYAFDTNRDYCYPEDESEWSSGVWVDLTGNAERFTGYEGPHARLMWSKVYAENCFGYAGEHQAFDHAGLSGEEESSMNNAADQLAEVMAHPLGSTDLVPRTMDNAPSEECIEQRLFYRLLSGMHASISTHLSYDWFNSTSDEWTSNLGEWLERVGWHEDRLNNLFFDYVLMSRAVSKLLEVYERQLLFSSTCQAVDSEVRVLLRRLGRILRSSPLYNTINEDRLFATPEGRALKAEFRQRVRNVNALMSCVGCERCRLWGKIQTAGYGTALKILFELPADPKDDEESVRDVLSTFRRSELVALINTFGRIAHSVEAVEVFQQECESDLVDQSSFSYQWKQAWRDTKAALKFILRSYIEFPKNLFKLTMLYANYYWTKFIMGERPFTDLTDLDSGFHAEL